MSIETIQYTTKLKLSCICNLPAPVVLCVTPGLAANRYCDEQTLDVGFIPASVIAVCEPKYPTGKKYTYTFEYDTDYLEPSRALLSKYITGVFCAGCLATWVEDRIGNEATMEQIADNTYQFTSQHGCQQTFEMAGGLGVDFFPGATLYGDGSDGNRVVTGEELLPTLVRAYYYNNLTIDAGGILHPWGNSADDAIAATDFRLRQFWPIYVAGTLTINGELNADGVSPPGLGYEALFANFEFIGLAWEGPGGAADTCTYIRNIGLNGVGPPFNTTCEGCGFMAGGLGGTGGNGGSGGGTGYARYIGDDSYPIKLGRLRREWTEYNGPDCLDNVISGGGGGGGAGGGGGGSGAGRGASSGGGGGTIIVYARNIVIGPSGRISSRGGNGCVGEDATSGANRGGGGGGAGGGGGLIYLVYDTFQNDGTLDVSPGVGAAGGAGINGGTSGTAGTDGLPGNIYKLNRNTGLFE